MPKRYTSLHSERGLGLEAWDRDPHFPKCNRRRLNLWQGILVRHDRKPFCSRPAWAQRLRPGFRLVVLSHLRKSKSRLCCRILHLYGIGINCPHQSFSLFSYNILKPPENEPRWQKNNLKRQRSSQHESVTSLKYVSLCSPHRRVQ